MKNPVGWFEVAVKDLDRAEKFYKELLNLDCDRKKEENGFEMSVFPMGEMDTPQAMGALVKSEQFNPSHDGTLVYFSCPNVEKTLEKAEDMEAKILLPKTNIGEHGFIAWVEDSEGNRIAVHSMAG